VRKKRRSRVQPLCPVSRRATRAQTHTRTHTRVALTPPAPAPPAASKPYRKLPPFLRRGRPAGRGKEMGQIENWKKLTRAPQIDFSFHPLVHPTRPQIPPTESATILLQNNAPRPLCIVFSVCHTETSSAFVYVFVSRDRSCHILSAGCVYRTRI